MNGRIDEGVGAEKNHKGCTDESRCCRQEEKTDPPPTRLETFCQINNIFPLVFLTSLRFDRPRTEDVGFRAGSEKLHVIELNSRKCKCINNMIKDSNKI